MAVYIRRSSSLPSGYAFIFWLPSGGGPATITLSRTSERVRLFRYSDTRPRLVWGARGSDVAAPGGRFRTCSGHVPCMRAGMRTRRGSSSAVTARPRPNGMAARTCRLCVWNDCEMCKGTGLESVVERVKEPDRVLTDRQGTQHQEDASAKEPQWAGWKPEQGPFGEIDGE